MSKLLATVLVFVASFAAAATSATLMAPYVTSAGVTKPPGSGADPRRGTTERLERLERELDRRIERSICAGCL